MDVEAKVVETEAKVETEADKAAKAAALLALVGAEFAGKAVADRLSGGALSLNEAKALGVDKDLSFKCATAPYLSTQHVFERIDASSYYHADTGAHVKGHLYGKCVNCGNTFNDMISRANQDAIPSLYFCPQAAQRQATGGRGGYGGGRGSGQRRPRVEPQQ
jgi:hypothetical protein